MPLRLSDKTLAGQNPRQWHRIPFGLPDERAETADVACVGPDLFSPRSIAGCGKRLSKELLTTVVHCPALWFH